MPKKAKHAQKKKRNRQTKMEGTKKLTYCNFCGLVYYTELNYCPNYDALIDMKLHELKEIT
jgi:uncharacterized OB-fold protein